MDGWRINKKGREPETIKPGPIRSPQGFLGCDITRGAVMDDLRLTFLRGNKPKEVTFRWPLISGDANLAYNSVYTLFLHFCLPADQIFMHWWHTHTEQTHFLCLTPVAYTTCCPNRRSLVTAAWQWSGEIAFLCMLTENDAGNNQHGCYHTVLPFGLPTLLEYFEFLSNLRPSHTSM